MLRSLTVSTLILGFACAFVQPQAAVARDRERYERHERKEFRERERREHRYARERDRDYRRGFYDRFGYWHWY